MKFSEVKIGSEIKSPNLYYFIKVDNKNASFIDDNGRWCTLKCEADSEWELITKCANCKWYDRNWKNLEFETDDDRDDHCHKLGIDICGDEYYALNVDKKTFSCSHFEMKTE